MSILNGIANPMIADIGANFREGEARGQAKLTKQMAGDILSNTFGGKLGALGNHDPEVAMKLAQGLGIPADDKARLQSFAGDIQAATAIANGAGPQEAVDYLKEVRDRRVQLIGSDSTPRLDSMIQYMEANPQEGVEALNLQTNALVEQGFLKNERTAGKSAEQRSFEDLIVNFTPEEKRKARRVKAGLEARAVGSAAQTITQEDIVQEIAATEQELAGAKETGKLTAQLKLAPKVKKAVDMAVGEAKALTDANADSRSDTKTLETYEIAMGSLAQSLDGTSTGPWVGWSPALTANQQIADGASAAMAPILKSLFRGAGEGTFTDQDQKLLMDMVPSRSDRRAARIAKLKNIDAIVRSKLGQGKPDGALTYNTATGEFE